MKKHVEVTKEVNLWAERSTNGLIKEIIPPGSIGSITMLILGNALSFKGAWERKFDASETQKYEFHLLNGRSIQAPFMTNFNKQYLSAFDGFKVLRLPYKQVMSVTSPCTYFLPDAKDGLPLPALVNRIGSDPGFLDHHIPASKVKVGNFLIPKFKISFGFEASKLLKRLGLVLPFFDEGLSKMVDCCVSQKTQNLGVSSIFHKSFIEVNEERTEAAAVTFNTLFDIMLEL